MVLLNQHRDFSQFNGPDDYYKGDITSTCSRNRDSDEKPHEGVLKERNENARSKKNGQRHKAITPGTENLKCLRQIIANSLLSCWHMLTSNQKANAEAKAHKA